MNIEEIKERLVKFRKSPPPNFKYAEQKEQFLSTAPEDIEYLLSLLEQAEKSLMSLDKAFKFDYVEDIKVIEHMAKESGINSGTAMTIYLQQAEEMEFRNKTRKVANEALQAIRK